MTLFSPALPIDAVLDEIGACLTAGRNAVLVAPPGAGKTTRVPLHLLAAPWMADRKLILLEPRRLAARAAAERMASTLGERVGETIGLRMRLEARVSAKTRIEVVTEGVFARMILNDPGLDKIAAVLFDEFHERSLDADLGLALAIDVQSGLRDDLRVLVMSATLDAARVSTLLGSCPTIESLGRSFPVETIYLGRDPRERIEDAVGRATIRAMGETEGSALVFLPGQSEIRRVAALLEPRYAGTNVEIAPLYSALDKRAQDQAIAPTDKTRRKIVLATSIAETSLTIEGVRIVVDAGLARVPRYEPDTGLTRLETQRVSRAAADQRRGRAGRTEPGSCYRLWEEAATGSFAAFATPEILAADMSGLVLDLASWGVRNPAEELRWLDPPPQPALIEARALLQALGAIEPDGALTDHGKAMSGLALPPRLAHMLIKAAESGEGWLASEIAAILVERGLGGDAADLTIRLTEFRRDRSHRAEDARHLAQNFARQAGAGRQIAGDIFRAGALLALAFPERIAKARGKPGEFLLANGRAAAVAPHDPLAREPFLAVGEIAGKAGAARILLAAPLSLEDFEAAAGARLEMKEELSFDQARGALTLRRQKRVGAIVLAEQNLQVVPNADTALLLADGIARRGVARLPWTKEQIQWRDRISFLRRHEGEAWPDVSDDALAQNAKTWLAPYLTGKISLADIKADDLHATLEALLPWDMKKRLEAEAPTHFTTPAGSHIAVDYAAEQGPTLSVRVQELYGLSTHPALAGGRVPLTLELLSPAHRPIQITRDLPGFWRGSWAAVKTEMKGRYPKHLWPDDPAAAQATTRAKPRNTSF
ncbi:ATP-dependent helicase HrpB [Methyloferula stellata]|uniref:ATP-dependent helicase HrpB n=1 Tax=Methyloferula stellata TaxID=876270 RepID=UPI00036A868E|nr:ATP-dependent helicase HrpB [Methyloferula stellata]